MIKAMMAGTALVLVLLLAGLMAFVRLAPDRVAEWHVALPSGPTESGVQVVSRGAMAFQPTGDPAQLLENLAKVAATQPRTRLLAGSVAEGRITWVARSLIWGFPDYITAEVTPQGLRLWSRQRYGSRDAGVNAARLAEWLAAL